MIAYLKGRIINKEEHSVILNVQDVGYQVFLDERTIKEVVPGEQEFYIHHHIREDASTLFGFKRLLDRRVFLALMSVSGIGPKSALAFLSGYSSEQILQAIIKSDLGAISGIPGVGKKTAEKVIIELRDKVAKQFPDIALGKPAKQAGLAMTGGIEDSFKTEIVQAMQSLGYAPKEIEQSIFKNIEAIKAADSVEQAIKILLKNL